MGWVDIHIINLMEAWVASQDIATLVRNCQGRDILAPMLARKEVELVSSFTHPDLVQRMVEEGVKGVSRDQLILFRLVNVPGILNLSASSGLGRSDSRFSLFMFRSIVTDFNIILKCLTISFTRQH